MRRSVPAAAGARVTIASKLASSTERVAQGVLAEILPLIAEVNQVLDLDKLLPRIAATVRRIVDYKFLDIFLHQPDGTLVPALVEGYSPELASQFRVALGEGIVGTAAARRETVFVPDISRDPRYITLFPGVVAELAIPLITNDELVGVLNVEGPDPHAFTPEAIMGLTVLANHLAAAIANAKLYRESRYYTNLLKNLHEIGKETTSILDLDALLTRLAEIVKRMIDYDSFGILLVDEAAGDLVLRKAVCFGPTKEKTRIAIGEGLTGHAVLARQPILVGDVLEDHRYVQAVPDTRSELVVPLIYKDRVVGVFDLESPHLNRFTQEHVAILMPLASQVAIAIENARLVEEIRRTEHRRSRELAIARQVQDGLFPEEAPRGEGWEAAAWFVPALELGGDLYDFYDLAEGRIGLAIGDVSGKGVPAALYGAFASGAVRARAFERHSPASLLARVNRTLRRRGVEGLYCTLTYALFDFRAHTMVLANSGSPYPLHYRAQDRTCTPIEIPGLPLGTFDGSEYDEHSIALSPGDILVFHSDGVTEAYNRRAEYSVARLSELVIAAAALGAGTIAERIGEDLRAFQGTTAQSDDATLVVVKVLEAPASPMA